MQEEYRTVIRRMASPLGLDKCFMETKETHTCHRTPEPSKELSKTSVLATSEVTNSTVPVGSGRSLGGGVITTTAKTVVGGEHRTHVRGAEAVPGG